MYKAELKGPHIVFNVAFIENHKCKSSGARFNPTTKQWQAKANKITAAAVMAQFPEKDVDPAIKSLAGPSFDIPPMGFDPDEGLRVVSLRPRQRSAIEKAWPYSGFAFFHVMGAGKTVSTIALANLRAKHGLIDRLLIICPTSIKGVWKKEIERYSSLDAHLQVLESGSPLKKWNGFPILVVGVEAMSQGGAAGIAREFVEGGRCMSVIDESSTVKNHDSVRTEKCWEIGEQSVFRLILTGTNVTQGLQDLFAQMYFVDPSIIGELSYYSFRNTYCVMGGFENKKIIGYTNTAVLLDRIRPYCDVVRKGDMKLPSKQYQVREVKASAEQVKACKELAREMTTKLGDKEISVQNALEAMLRFQQIAGGHDPEGNQLSKNPKLTELVSLLGEFDGKAIIWARYLPEIGTISERLEKEWAGSVMTITGAVPPPERQPMVDKFEASSKMRFLVVNQQTCGKGLTIIAATLSVYYSNTFSLEDRMQSEDRNHRIGQENEVTYVDLMSDLKVDRTVVTALSNKMSVSEYVNNGLLTVSNLL